MKLKLDEAGHAVLQDGKPIYIHDDGKEVPFDAAGTVATITRINGEAKGHRERAEAAEKALKGFEGIADPAAAIKALETVAAQAGQKMVDAGEFQRVKDDITKGFTEKLTTAEKRAADLEANWSRSEISRAFASSQFIKDKSAIPADFMLAALSDRVKFDGGKITVYDVAGNKMLSRAKPGEDASFDEAIEMVVDGHPQRDTILKGNTNGGGGARQGGTGGGAKTMSRAQFDALDAASKMTAMTKDGVTITD